MTSARTFLFAGGGSGGHLFPGIAVAEEILRRDPGSRIVFAGSDRGIEKAILARTGWRHVALSVSAYALSARRPVRSSLSLGSAVRGALRLIDETRPEAVIGLGGFASVPVAAAARVRAVPVVLLEQNVVPGRATSLISRWADEVCVSFAETIPMLPRGVRCRVTGNPVRREVLRRLPPRSRRGETLLILGGSQGAVGLNGMAVSAIRTLRERVRGWRVVHQTGERDVERVRAAYAEMEVEAEVAAFFDDLPARYANAALAVSRAGATTLAELACLGVPAVLVPYPGAVRDHQARNAEYYAALGAAVMVSEGDRAGERLAVALSGLSSEPSQLSRMSAAMGRCAKPDATAAVADVLVPRAAAAAAA